ncbi:hypothetical protein VINI7043_05966 [Vibrio nigripulchritudo ATCC 27043]|nr:hypothetical protein VINI7043_05966 [Vibrio nigripulchritudo ATCC 27043]
MFISEIAKTKANAISETVSEKNAMPMVNDLLRYHH